MKIRLRLLTPILILFFSVSHSGFGQEKIVNLTGKVQSLSNDVSDVLVINLTTKKTTITNNEGIFSLEVKLNDSIQFTAVQYLTKKIMVTNTILNTNMMLIHLVDNIVKLDEVTVMPYNLTGNVDLDMKRIEVKPITTASSLKLPNSNVPVMTHTERLLLEADRGKFVKGGVQLDTLFFFPIVGLYIDINVHKTLNYISGRTKTLKDMVSRDKNIKMENEIIQMFSKKNISEESGIPLEHIDGFLTFCLSQKDFAHVSNMANSFEVWEYLMNKSDEFKEANSFKE
ncbi:hypothetical protein DKG77_15390 [Flagellimonas aquimarina]|uniref:Carboxypeptidase-like regulatory domain-containing protein n=1 Tax=Flagellimonas aquimarina TaxID=2201895 RepID=A0A316KVV0_9FLAO|nr:hypothetical protein [Allomuricauda koreensis]PWL37681.1 hypothetical protein DKG77_15390 [Allomuricauda koreensis]